MLKLGCIFVIGFILAIMTALYLAAMDTPPDMIFYGAGSAFLLWLLICIVIHHLTVHPNLPRLNILIQSIRWLRAWMRVHSPAGGGRILYVIVQYPRGLRTVSTRGQIAPRAIYFCLN